MHPDSVPSVTPADVDAGALLVDVREADEWAAGHVDGSLFVPMSSLPGRAGDIPRDRDVVVVCKVGGRSAQVAAWLNRQGWRASNLDGGLIAWERAGRPLVSDGGAAPFVA